MSGRAVAAVAPSGASQHPREGPPRRIAVYGATEEALQLLPALARRRDLELVVVYDPSARELRRRLALIEPGAARVLQGALRDDFEACLATSGIEVAVDGGLPAALRERLATRAAARGVDLLSVPSASQRLDLAPTAWREPTAPPAPSAGATGGSLPAAPIPATPQLADAIDAAIRSERCFVLLRCGPDPAPDPDTRGDATDPARIRARILESLRRLVPADARLEAATSGSVWALWITSGADETAARRKQLVRAAAEAVAEALRDVTPRPSTTFGYALHPEDGRDRETLLRRALVPRIRTV